MDNVCGHGNQTILRICFTKNIRYILTPSGISERTKLTINFMKIKMKEYEELKKELKS